ncbi:hypothetical protein PYCCODRAFT_176594 [Trametes coccinea BRFM310]|uniref:Uncharacterized protein n=1 Tax=Trametes coccinea (strain BRFM310) TaxID=1353009 RepID=A0A1Y2ITZ1_TRAC3|nr:hypothetical protein PYCCODRAFT_176594 [Trametes coccinea BRFM310]
MLRNVASQRKRAHTSPNPNRIGEEMHSAWPTSANLVLRARARGSHQSSQMSLFLLSLTPANHPRCSLPPVTPSSIDPCASLSHSFVRQTASPLPARPAWSMPSEGHTQAQPSRSPHLVAPTKHYPTYLSARGCAPPPEA